MRADPSEARAIRNPAQLGGVVLQEIHGSRLVASRPIVLN